MVLTRMACSGRIVFKLKNAGAKVTSGGTGIGNIDMMAN